MKWFDVDVTIGEHKHTVRLTADSRAVATRIVRSWGGRKITGVRQTPPHCARKLDAIGWRTPHLI